MKGRWLGVFSVVAACSSRGGSLGPILDGGARADVTAAGDTGAGPDDAGAGPDDTATATTDTGAPPADTGPATGCTVDSECSALGRVCDRVMSRCVECIADADCARGRYCLPSHVCTAQVCMPGESSCLGGARQSVCNARGSAQVESACASGETCRGGRCQPAACTPGAATCDDVTGGRRVCNTDGSGTSVVPCPSGQRCRDNACAALACTPNSRTCVGTTSLRTCNATGTEATTMDCPALPNAPGACAASTCGFVCATGFGNCDATFSNGCETALGTSNAHCGACNRACATGQTCSGGFCGTATTSGNFRVTSLGTTGCRTLAHESYSGDDRGGIAVSSDAVYYNGDTSTVRASAVDLSSPAALGVIHDGIFSDLATGQVYVLLDATGAEVDQTADVTVTQLGRLAADGTLPTAGRVPLSQPVVLRTTLGTPGVFSGYGRLVLFAGRTSPTESAGWYDIALPSGAVTPLGPLAMPPHSGCENWAAWGIAESIGGNLSVVFVSDGATISRYSLTTLAVTTVSTFTDLGDMCSITFSPARNRWYFHSESTTQFTPVTTETLGYCTGSWTSSP